MRVRGVRGVNRLDFTGRVRGKPVRPGVYLLTLTRGTSRVPVLRPLLVKVISPRRTILLRARAALPCDSPAVTVDKRPGVLALGFALPTTPVAASPASGASPAPSLRRSPDQQASTPSRPGRNHEVLGVEVHVPALPEPEDWHAWHFAVVVLLVGLPLLLMLALVVRFLRGSWNP